MGRIIETKYHDTVEKITGFNSSLVHNSFYTLNDKKPTIVTYYNINKDKSSLDPGSKLSYNNIGDDSSIRFNKIDDFIIYGFPKIELQTENDEFGLEAEKISGECFILPNTITPTEGDYFEVEHITDSTWLFIVTDVQQDTLENGSNVYKISFKLEYVDHDRILNNVVENFKMIEKREGTNSLCVVESSKLEKAKFMDKIAVMLKEYYNDLFYNDKVQTFTYMDLTEWRIYDPFMVEFLIRNKILDNGNNSYIDSFVYVTHQIQVDKTFSIDYDKSFYRVFENRDPSKILSSEYNITFDEIKSYGTTFSSRYETYYKAIYRHNPIGYNLQCINDDIIYRISNHDLVEYMPNINNKDDKLWENILIKYFYDEEFTDSELLSIQNLDFVSSPEAFYLVPLLILCLEYTIEKALN